MDRFLLPILQRQCARVGTPTLRCLQIQPDDEDEAERVRALGHTCAIALWRPEEYDGREWHRFPVVADPFRLPFKSQQFDLIFTGALGPIAAAAPDRRALGRELARVCAESGGFLSAVGNRYCPIDLTSSRGRIHGPRHPEKFSVGDLRHLLLAEDAFPTLQLLSVSGHFGFSKIRGPLRSAVAAIRTWTEWASDPKVMWRYAGPLNPTLMVLAQKGQGGF